MTLSWPATGVWVAAYSDGSAVYIFASEIEALRFANGLSLDVSFWEFGPEHARKWYQ